MNEEQILFNMEMIISTLALIKTETRLVVKFPKQAYSPDTEWIASVNPDGVGNWVAWGPTAVSDEFSINAYPDGGGFKCPYGKPGDQLWVRETWQWCPECGQVNWKAGANENGSVCQHCDDFLSTKWKPSIHMFRDDSRITLEVVSVGVERVQDIGEVGAINEGVEPLFTRHEIHNEAGHYRKELDLLPMPYMNYLWHGRVSEGKITQKQSGAWYNQRSSYLSAVESFSSLWESINAGRGYSWESNPWVWVVKFKLLEVDNGIR